MTHNLLPKDRNVIYNNLIFFFIGSLFGVFTYPYILSRGGTLTDILLFEGIVFGLPLINVLLVQKINSKFFIPFVFITRAIGLILFMLLPLPYNYIIAAALISLEMVYYFIPTNMALFRNDKKKSHGVSATATALPIVVSIVTPLLAGIIVKYYGYDAYFIVGGLITLLGAWIITYVPVPAVSFNAVRGVRKLAKVRSLVLLEGAFAVGTYSLIPVYTLFFIKDPLEYGSFLAYLTLFGIICTLLVGKFMHGDGLRKNAATLTSFAIAINIIALGFVSDIYTWFIATSTLTFLMILFMPFLSTISIKNSDASDDIWAGRELLLAIGRTVSFIIMILCIFIFKSPQLAIMCVGVIFLAFPIILYTRKLKA